MTITYQVKLSDRFYDYLNALLEIRGAGSITAEEMFKDFTQWIELIQVCGGD
mgnify:CR=1 FL=1